jgi:P4 family phage/plasmid primase-like protien
MPTTPDKQQVNPLDSNTLITYLANVERPWEFSEIPFAKALDEIKSDKYKSQIEVLRVLYRTDPKAYKEAKLKLAAYGFNGTFTTRVNNNNFKLSSETIGVDIDALEGSLEDHKFKITTNIPSVVCCFDSPSGAGLKVSLRVATGEIKNDEDFKRAFAKAECVFAAIGYTIDPSCKDVKRACYTSHDPNVYVNWEADILPIPPECSLESVKAPIIPDIREVAPYLEQETATLTGGLFSVESEIFSLLTNMMRGAADGRRHGVRLAASRLAGGYIAGGLLNEAKALELITTLSDQIAEGGCTSDRELKTIAEGIAKGKESPLTIDDFKKTHGYNVAVFDPAIEEGAINTLNANSTDARDGTATTRPLTELGNAQRLSDSHANDVKHIEGAGCFIHWNCNWQWDVSGAMTRTLAAALPTVIYKEGEQYQQQALKFAAWSRSSQSESTIKATVSLYKDFPQARVPFQLVDGNQYMVGLDNARQVIDLKAGVVRPAERADFITKTLNAQELGQALKAQRWLLFLNEVFGDDPELIFWLQRWCGYILTGSTAEQCFLFCYGFGANGKSVLIDTLRYVLGDYARAIASETLTETKRAAGSASPDLADLIGARLALTTETEEGVALAESLLKALTGGDTLTARKLYSAPTQFTPQFKIMMSGNHKPLIKGNDDGIWRRVRLLPFTKTFSGNQRDTRLSEKLRAEAPHILAWMVEGCLAWQQNGLADIPATIKAATADYKEDQDLIGAWLADCCQLTNQCEGLSTTLYNSYKFWCDTNGLMKSSNKVFGRRLAERGFTSRRSNGISVWAGVVVIPDAVYSHNFGIS